MNDPRGVGITRLGQVAIPVHDVGRATTFYGDVLGLRFLFQAGQLAFFDCGGVRLMLDRPEKPEFDPLLRRSRYAGGAWTPGRCRRCGRRGAPPEPMPDHNLWMGVFAGHGRQRHGAPERGASETLPEGMCAVEPC